MINRNEITLTEGQEKGLKIALSRYHGGDLTTTINGYAGTGKTTLVRILLEELGVGEDEYLIGSYTGKATLKLQQTGFPNARTLHNICFHTVKSGKNFIHKKKSPKDFAKYKVFIIDEISMVPKWILQFIASLGMHVICLGDKFQLPPIGEDNRMLAAPNITLDEIVRQGEGNSIIWFSKLLRDGKLLPMVKDDFIQVYESSELTPGMMLWADQVICGLNKTRHDINEVIRLENGYLGELPEVGEKVIVTQNNWGFLNSDQFSLVNGMLGEVSKVSRVLTDDRSMLVGGTTKTAFMDIKPDFQTSEFHRVRFDALPFILGTNSFDLFKEEKDPRERMNQVEFGYAITGHKSQGSEYNKVLAIEERAQRGDLLHRRWLYTVMTRAKDKLVIVRDRRLGVWED